MLYEALLLIGVYFLGFIAPNIALGIAMERVLPGPILLAQIVLITAAYFFWFWHRGRTLAMQTWKMGLTSVNGYPPSNRQLLLRFLLAWPSIFFFGAGLIWAVFDRDRQFLHDRLAGTRLVLLSSP